MDDEKIIELLFNRDQTALNSIKCEYGKLCLQIANNILKNKEDAEECVNDTFLAVWNKIPPTRPNNLKAFICKITRNLSLKKLEYTYAKKRHVDVILSLNEIEETVPDSSFKLEIEDDEVGSLISIFLRKEKALERNVFLRKYWFFDSIEEIANKYNISQSRVKSMLFRTRNRLRNYLRNEGFNYE